MSIDYSKYSRAELLDVLEHIDAESYPERVEAVKRALTHPDLLSKSEKDFESASINEINLEIKKQKETGNLNAIKHLEDFKTKKKRATLLDSYGVIVTSPLLCWLLFARAYKLDKTSTISVFAIGTCVSIYLYYKKGSKT